MKKTFLKIACVLMVLTFVFAFNTSFGSVKETGIEKNIEYQSGLSGIYSSDGNKKIDEAGGKVIGVVQLICYAAAIIILLYKGVQYMFAAPDAKADIKKSLINVAIGALILFAVGTIVKVVGTIAMNNIN